MRPYEELIVDIPNYPKPGVVFKDLTPAFADADAFAAMVDDLAAHFADHGITKVVGAEARGFIVGAAVALRLGAGFVPCRKPVSYTHLDVYKRQPVARCCSPSNAVRPSVIVEVPPLAVVFSSQITWAPRSAALMAAKVPALPDPTTTTSASSVRTMSFSVTSSVRA